MTSELTWKVVDDVASKLGVSEAARLKWRQGGRGVPPIWRIRITETLTGEGAQVALSDFDALQSTPGRIAA